MLTAKALAIVYIQQRTTICDLDDVVGKHAVLWVATGATFTMHDSLASSSCTSDDLGSPGSELG